MKLGLGTVQFGLDYGIANTAGRTGPDEVRRILAAAGARGVRLLDTASLYGESESALGAALPDGHAFRVVTKTGKFPSGFGPDEARSLEEAFHASLGKLRMPAVYGLLAHASEDLLGPGGDRMMESLLRLKAQGKVAKVGASVYSEAQVDALLDRHPIDLVQLPFSALDQRMLRGGQLRRLKSAGVEVHARSVFLQGLLLMDLADLPAYFEPVRPLLAGFREAARAQGMSPLRAALAFVSAQEDIDSFLVGVCSLEQCREILDALEPGLSRPPDFSAFHCGEERFVNPSLWRTGR